MIFDGPYLSPLNWKIAICPLLSFVGLTLLYDPNFLKYPFELETTASARCYPGNKKDCTVSEFEDSISSSNFHFTEVLIGAPTIE